MSVVARETSNVVTLRLVSGCAHRRQERLAGVEEQLPLAPANRLELKVGC